jgi:hypothetical protein
MASSYTPLLGLVLPVTGELSGSWGSVWNDSGTSLIDAAISGTTSLTTDADVTLTTTTGAANEARQAIILWNPASGTTTRNITAPAQSKIYTVINASGGTQSIVFRGVGPTTGVTIVKGESAVVAWNGTDFIKISNAGGSASFTNVTVSGTTTLSGLTASTALALDASKNVVSVTNTGTGNNVLATSPTLVTPALGTPSSATLTNATGLPVATGISGLGSGVATFLATPSSANLAAAVTDETGTGALVFANSPTLVTPALGTPSSVTLTNATGLPVSTGISGLGTGVATALAVNVGTAGAPVINGGVLGTPSSGTVTNLTGTASININGTVGATTASTGAFTTLAASGAVTLSGGTANGVAFLNASKVLTTGSALTFDGTNLGVGTAAPGVKLDLVQTGASSGGALLRVYNATDGVGAGQIQIAKFGSSASYGPYSANTVGVNASGTNLLFGTESNHPVIFYQNNAEQMRLTSTGLGIGTSSISYGASTRGNLTLGGSESGLLAFQIGGVAKGYVGHFDSNMQIWNDVNSPILFGVNSAEQMRLTSTGLGIGTSSPGYKLDVQRQSYGVTAQFYTNDGTGNPRLAIYGSSSGTTIQNTWSSGASNLIFANGGAVGSGTEVARFDVNGNLGLGITPSAWGAGLISLDLRSESFISGGGNYIALLSNTYFNSGARYKTTGYNATQYLQQSGAHIFYTAPSGTAGNAISFTQALTLTAEGNLVAGATTSSFRINATVASGADRDIFLAGVSGATNGFTVKWNHSTTTTRVNIQNLPTSSAGLAAGDLYVLAGALMVA